MLDTEALIIGDILSGNKARYSELVRKYNQRLFRIGRSYLNRTADVEDAMQEAYVKAYLSLAHLEEPAYFGTWITRILINECLQRIRQQKKSELLPIGDGEPHGLTEEMDPATDAMEKEFRTIFEECVEALPEKYRLVFVMREIEKMSTLETAAALSITGTNVKVRLNRARELMKQRLLEAYPASELYHFMGPRCDAMVERVMTAVMGAPRL